MKINLFFINFQKRFFRGIYFLTGIFLLTGCQATQPLGEGGKPAAVLMVAPPALRQVEAQNLQFNAQEGKISYTLSEDALVRLRVGIDNRGPMLETLIDWQPRKAGQHEEIWDRLNDEKNVEFPLREDLTVIIFCFALDDEMTTDFVKTLPGFHSSPQINVELLEHDKIYDHAVVIRDEVKGRIRIEKQDLQWMNGLRFGATVFINNILAAEEKNGVSPMTFTLNTKYLKDGFHTIHVNVWSYAGETAVKSIPVYIDNEYKLDNI